jgi:plasmid maintenance system antidote protein VapI
MKKREVVLEDIWNDEKIALVKNHIKSSRKKLSPDEILNIELLSIKYRIEEYLNSTEDKKPMEILDFVKLYLKTLKVTQKNLAELFEMDSANLHKYLTGQRKLNGEFVLKLSAFTSIEPEKWFQIEARNELLEIRKKFAKANVNYVKQFQSFIRERKKLVVNDYIEKNKGRE